MNANEKEKLRSKSETMDIINAYKAFIEAQGGSLKDLDELDFNSKPKDLETIAGGEFLFTPGTKTPNPDVANLKTVLSFDQYINFIKSTYNNNNLKKMSKPEIEEFYKKYLANVETMDPKMVIGYDKFRNEIKKKIYASIEDLNELFIEYPFFDVTNEIDLSQLNSTKSTIDVISTITVTLTSKIQEFKSVSEIIDFVSNNKKILVKRIQSIHADGNVRYVVTYFTTKLLEDTFGDNIVKIEPLISEGKNKDEYNSIWVD